MLQVQNEMQGKCNLSSANSLPPTPSRVKMATKKAELANQIQKLTEATESTTPAGDKFDV